MTLHPPSASDPATRGFRPSEHPLALAAVGVLAAGLGYVGQFSRGHNARATFQGWLGALIAVATVAAVFGVMELAARRQR